MEDSKGDEECVGVNNWEEEVELEGKRREDYDDTDYERVWVEGVVIVGAGPSGLATAACLKSKGIPSLILERSQCVGSMWQHKTYDRLRLHLPKQFCQLPLFPFPSNFPSYPSKHHFLSYLHSYSLHFNLSPSFHTTVLSAHFHPHLRRWLLLTRHSLTRRLSLFLAPSLVVATGENALPLLPRIPGLRLFRGGPVLHTSAYKTGSLFRGKDVLVVGCGNSGMEVCLDLCNHNARAWLVVRDTVHVLPQHMFGKSTFGLSMCLLKWLPVKLVDAFLLFISRIMLGDTATFGLPRPNIGPLHMKNVSGKTPVLDVGTLAHIKSGKIKVCRGISRVTEQAVEFVDGKVDKFDAIILATGYKSSVPSWLKGSEMFNEKDGMPRKAFPNGWKGENGLYAVGFTKRGLLGASMDAMRIAQDIERTWKSQQIQPPANLFDFTSPLP